MPATERAENPIFTMAAAEDFSHRMRQLRPPPACARTRWVSASLISRMRATSGPAGRPMFPSAICAMQQTKDGDKKTRASAGQAKAKQEQSLRNSIGNIGPFAVCILVIHGVPKNISIPKRHDMVSTDMGVPENKELRGQGMQNLSKLRPGKV